MFPYAPWLVFLVPAIGALLIPLTAKVGERFRDLFSVFVSLITSLISISMVPDVFDGTAKDILNGYLGVLPFDWRVLWIPNLSGFSLEVGVLVDPLSVLMANVAADLAFLICLYSLGYMAHDKDKTRYWFFMLLFISGMELLVISDNFLTMFVGWEIVGVCSYALIGFWYKKKGIVEVDFVGEMTEGDYNARCGMKAFITTRVGDVALLVSILTIFWATYLSGNPTFNFLNLNESYGWVDELSKSGLLLITAILMFGGSVGKSAQFPLHVWLPDAMAGPTTVSALIHAATMVKAGVYLVARVYPLFHDALWMLGYNELEVFFTVVAFTGAFTSFLSATMALVSHELKRVLAYSTVSQLGYMLLALGSGGLLPEAAYGYFAGTFHLFAHAVFKALLFLGAGAVLHVVETKDMFEMGGLKKYMPITYTTFLIGALSLSGIPPLTGFWSKESIFSTLILLGERNPIVGYSLLTIAVLTASLTVFYSFRMIGMTFHGSESERVLEVKEEGKLSEAPTVMTIPLIILASITLIAGFVEPIFSNFIFKTWEHPLELTYGEMLNEVLSPTLLLTISAIALGFVPSYMMYIRREWSPEKILERSPILAKLWDFLWNGWYIDAFYNVVLVDGFINLSKALYTYIERYVFDNVNVILNMGSDILSEKIRKLQTGDLNYNILGILMTLSASLIYLIYGIYVTVFSISVILIFLIFLKESKEEMEE
ncbi:MAG: NADH-quinone oxidoreductase subunit L [Candidatus Odinarchaeota archaeon]|nr:NADH-quinone oxidoreductase subunit L [Candidatus Odinarchaeota archaeon]